jgi:biopolymer transport protein ExbB
VFTLVQQAGWPIWFLIIASIIAVALIAERLIFLRARNVAPPNLLSETVQQLRDGNVNKELLAQLAQGSPLGRVLAAALKNANSAPEAMKEAVEEAGRAASHELDRFLTTLGTIASISPLLGLFGTVVGMIEIFSAQSAVGNTPTVLAHGISVALYNTAFGLIVAVPSMIFYRHFRAKVDSLVIEMEQQAVKLVEILNGARKK